MHMETLYEVSLVTKSCLCGRTFGSVRQCVSKTKVIWSLFSLQQDIQVIPSMVSKASREEKTKAKNSSDVDRLADLLGAIKINEVCAEIRQQSSNPACLNMLYSSSLVKRRDCRGYEVDWTKDTSHVGGGIIPSPVSPVRQQGFKCGKTVLAGL